MTDVTELFSRDPMNLTEDDITEIIAKMREQRKTFKAMPAGKTPKKLTDKEQKIKALGLDKELKL